MGCKASPHEPAILIKNTEPLYASCILLESRQPPWLKIARTTAIRREHPVSICAHWSSGSNRYHALIQKVILCIPCRNWALLALLKITSFLQFQIAHIKVYTPMQTRNLTCLFIPFNQFPNRFLIFVGGDMLKVKCTTPHSNFANVHLINKCSMDSC
jgi:hypothetical protein